MTKLDEIKADFDRAMTAVGGCGDGYCLITGKAKGMHTNGGCHCWREPMKAQIAMRAARRLREALNEDLA